MQLLQDTMHKLLLPTFPSVKPPLKAIHLLPGWTNSRTLPQYTDKHLLKRLVLSDVSHDDTKHFQVRFEKQDRCKLSKQKSRRLGVKCKINLYFICFMIMFIIFHGYWLMFDSPTQGSKMYESVLFINIFVQLFWSSFCSFFLIFS